jgi:type II secretory pathway pseudopilin PulG
MEISVLQLVVVAVVIVGAGGVALLCDFLKHKNAQLREEMAALRARREEQSQRSASVPSASVPRMPMVSAPKITPEMEQAETSVEVLQPPARRAKVEEPVPTDEITPMVERPGGPITLRQALQTGRIRGRAQSAPPNADPTEGLVRKSTPAIKVQKPEIAPLTAADITSVIGRRAAAPTPVVPEIFPEEPVRIEAIVTPSAPIAPPVAPAVTQPVPKDELSDWLSQRAAKRAKSGREKTVPVTVPVEPASENRFQLIRNAASNSATLVVPSGMHDQVFLSRLTETNKPFTGLAVSISVTDQDGRFPNNSERLIGAAAYVATLLGEKEFGCRTSDDEFLLICPGVTGTEATRRQGQISERLWDYQLRGIGASSILFSWGGSDAEDAQLSEVISAARDRMQQTRRGRKTVSMDSADRRKVV